MTMSIIIALQTSDKMITLCTRTIRENEDHPNGIACKLFEATNKKMYPDDVYAQMKMAEEILKLKLKKGQDPENMSNAIEQIIGKFSCQPTDKDIIAVIQQHAKDTDYGEAINQQVY